MKTLSVPEMSCGHCKAAIEKAIGNLDPQAQVQVDLESKTVKVETVADDPALLAALKEEGYEATITG